MFNIWYAPELVNVRDVLASGPTIPYFNDFLDVHLQTYRSKISCVCVRVLKFEFTLYLRNERKGHLDSEIVKSITNSTTAADLEIGGR